MDITAVIALLTHGNQLKRTARTGWTMRGIPNAEDVAAHSFGVVYTALILCQIINKPIDQGKVLAIATLHDLPEGLTTDIPTPAWRYLPAGVKTDIERGAMQEILSDLSFSPQLMALWEELHANETIEAKLVHDADKIDMFLQATIYEAQFGNAHLAEFWTKPYQFNFPECQAIYDELRAHRK